MHQALLILLNIWNSIQNQSLTTKLCSRGHVNGYRKKKKKKKPDQATMSVAERPLDLNRWMSWLTVEVTEGRVFTAAFMLAVFESLRPSFTFQYGPPSCMELINGIVFMKRQSS